MAYRSSMEAIILRLRVLISDEDLVTWSADKLQDFCDLHRVEVRQQPLRAVASRTASTSTYKIFYADQRDWEVSPTLQNSNYTTVVAGLPDLYLGRWEFADDQNGALPLLITGYCYDLYGAAVSVIEAWLAKLRGTAVDFTTDDLSIKDSQQVKTLEAALAQYRERAGKWGGVALLQQQEDGIGSGRFIQTDFSIGRSW